MPKCARSSTEPFEAAKNCERIGDWTAPLKKLLAADGASVYVYSKDDALVATVQDAGGEQYPVHAVELWTELVSVIDSGLCHIVLLDTDTLSERLEKHIAE